MAPQAAQTFGYMRVSSTDQNEDRQRRALADAAVPQEHLYLDRQSGKDFQRPQYQRLVKRLRAGVGKSTFYRRLRALRAGEQV